MSGRRYLLDTNAIIALLSNQQKVVVLAQSANWIGISIISQLEFLAFDRLSQSDRKLSGQFRTRVEVINLSTHQPDLLRNIIEIRQNHRLKLPDAIIVASALQTSSTLVTADQEFQKVEAIDLYLF